LRSADGGRRQLLPARVLFKLEETTSALALIEGRASLLRAGVETREEFAVAEMLGTTVERQSTP
jgi:hypothetical protein